VSYYGHRVGLRPIPRHCGLLSSLRWLKAVTAGLLLSVFERNEPLVLDDPNENPSRVPALTGGPRAVGFAHLSLPIVVLVWALMVIALSPGTVAFWPRRYMVALILVNTASAMALFRGESQFANDVVAVSVI